MGETVTTPKEQENKAFQGLLDQKEVNYVPLSAVDGKACANCRWFIANNWDNNIPTCHLVSSYPEPILATGYCDRQELPVPRIPDLSNPLAVVIVDTPMAEDDSMEMALPATRRGLKELISSWLKPVIGEDAPKPLETPQKAFTAFKGKDGQYFWLARHTGKYVDREDEIIADHAHDEFVTRVQKGLVPMPELWTWHKKGTAHGAADFVWKSGGFVCALGHFTGTVEQQARAAKWYNEHPDTKLSHMFKFPKEGKRGKVYHAYNTVEITTLPDGAEAFPYTTFEGVGTMPLTSTQREMIRGIGGDEMLTRAESLDAKSQTDTVKMDEAGVASKNTDNFEGSVIPGLDEEKALMLAQKDLDARLKVIESLPATLATLNTTVKQLLDEVGTLRQSNTEAVTRANDLEKKLAEYQTVAPPASTSPDTLINARDKSLIEAVVEKAKSGDSLSLIEKAMGVQPTVGVS